MFLIGMMITLNWLLEARLKYQLSSKEKEFMTAVQILSEAVFFFSF